MLKVLQPNVGCCPICQSPITRRLPLLVDKLNEMHYQARWEAGRKVRGDSGQMPYAKVIVAHPDYVKWKLLYWRRQSATCFAICRSEVIGMVFAHLYLKFS